MARVKKRSRPTRWADAISNAQDALGKLDSAYSEMDQALEELKDVQGKPNRRSRRCRASERFW